MACRLQAALSTTGLDEVLISIEFLSNKSLARPSMWREQR
jgi:hypothetical protein